MPLDTPLNRDQRLTDIAARMFMRNEGRGFVRRYINSIAPGAGRDNLTRILDIAELQRFVNPFLGTATSNWEGGEEWANRIWEHGSNSAVVQIVATLTHPQTHEQTEVLVRITVTREMTWEDIRVALGYAAQSIDTDGGMSGITPDMTVTGWRGAGFYPQTQP